MIRLLLIHTLHHIVHLIRRWNESVRMPGGDIHLVERSYIATAKHKTPWRADRRQLQCNGYPEACTSHTPRPPNTLNGAVQCNGTTKSWTSNSTKCICPVRWTSEAWQMAEEISSACIRFVTGFLFWATRLLCCSPLSFVCYAFLLFHPLCLFGFGVKTHAPSTTTKKDEKKNGLYERQQ